MFELIRRIKSIKSHNVPPSAIIFGAAVFTILANTPLVLLFCYADKLGMWWFPILVAYFGCFLLMYAAIIKPREMAMLLSARRRGFFPALPVRDEARIKAYSA